MSFCYSALLHAVSAILERPIASDIAMDSQSYRLREGHATTDGLPPSGGLHAVLLDTVPRPGRGVEPQ
jgi:hypothetical protein